MQTKITKEIWADSQFEELEPSEKLAVFWLLTKCSLLGWIEVSRKRFEFETGVSWESFEGACKGLPRMLKPLGRGVWIRTYIRHQFGCGPALARNNMARGLVKHLGDAPSEVVESVLSEYPVLEEIYKGLPSPSEGVRVRVRVRVGEEGSAEGRSEDTQHATAQALELVDTEAKAQTTRQRLQLAEKIYAAYPRKVAKGAALKAIDRALQHGLVDHDELLAAVTDYAAAVRKAGIEPQFIPHCATWINASRWEDDRDEWLPPTDQSGGQKKEGGAFDPIEAAAAARPAQIAEPPGWQQIAEDNFEMRWQRWDDVPPAIQQQIRKLSNA